MDMTERNDALFLLSMRLHHHGVISCKDTTFFQYFQIYTKKTPHDSLALGFAAYMSAASLKNHAAETTILLT